MIKSLIRRLVLEILSEEDIKPKADKLKAYIFSKKDMHPLDAILTQDVKCIVLHVGYIDVDNSAKHNSTLKFDSAHDFYSGLVNHVPVYDYFNSVHLKVVYNHNFGEQDCTDVIVNQYDKKVYHKDEFNKIFDPIIDWFKDKPELII